ncbi:MAG: transcription termination/antitermination protein NusG [Thermodesulfobacteriota bacterium]|nr:transcription termination/antitermination protein NusG [Thermodesulfobacteriota bacterium]
MANRWYVVHVYSGFEQKVKIALEERIAALKFSDKFGEVLVPTEHVIELVNGKKRESSRKFYPGYILVNMELNDKTWHVVTSTAKVTGFLGGKNKPTPISDSEAQAIISRMEQGKNQPQPKYTFDIGDDVRVTDGPFTDFNGTVEEVNHEKGKLKVYVSIFGRATPVELDFVQVTRI